MGLKAVYNQISLELSLIVTNSNFLITILKKIRDSGKVSLP